MSSQSQAAKPPLQPKDVCSLEYLMKLAPTEEAICRSLTLGDMVSLSMCCKLMSTRTRAMVSSFTTQAVLKVVDNFSYFRSVLQKTESFAELDIRLQAGLGCRRERSGGRRSDMTIFVSGQYNAARPDILHSYFTDDLGYKVLSTHKNTVSSN